MAASSFCILLITAMIVVSGKYVIGQLVCDAGETKIPSPSMNDYDKPTCTDVISAPPDLARLDFREMCQRWLVLPDLPDYVANYYIFYCTESSSYTTYQADICCTGSVTGLHCFTCTNFTSDTACTHDPAVGTVAICTAGQVCQTTHRAYGYYPNSQTRKTTGCGDQVTCEALDDNDVNTCKDWIPEPQCTDCCTTAFCNQNTQEYYLDAVDTPCRSNPCYNGGSCSYNIGDWTYTCTCSEFYTGSRCQTSLITTPAPPPSPCQLNDCENGGYCYNTGNDYECWCRQGYGGKNCSYEYGPCDEPSPCLNGGTCIDHEDYGYKCACTEDFVGARCEIANLVCSTSIGLVRETSTYYTTSSYNCTRLVESERSSGLTDSSNKNYCLSRMQQPGKPQFRDNYDGDVNTLESASYWYCEEGEDAQWYKEEYCCPSCYSMPCENGAWCTQDNDDDSYICKCRYGWTGTHCQNKRNLCIINGDPHYNTFDGATITYQGEKSYILTKNATYNGLRGFTVIGDNSGKGCPPGNNVVNGAVKYLDSMEIQVLGSVVKFSKANGNPHDPPVLVAELNGQTFEPLNNGETGITGLKIFRAGVSLVLEAALSDGEGAPVLTVEYNGQCLGSIDMPPEYAGGVEGMCGNCDANPWNDWTTREGVNVINETDRNDEVGDSWEYISNNRRTPRSREVVVNSVLDCPPEFEDDVSSNTYCGLIKDVNGVFRSCVMDAEVNHDSFFSSCHYDVCAYSNWTAEEMKFMACRSLEGFAIKCESKGYVVDWRGAAGCPMPCSNSSEYKSLAPACHATCGWPDAPEQCHLPNREGCYCPNDMVLDSSGECVAAQTCGCTDEDGVKHQIGDSWITADCGKNYTCVECTDCPRPVGKIISQPHNCQCVEANGKVWQIGESGITPDCAWNVTCGVCHQCTPIIGAFLKVSYTCAENETCVEVDGHGRCEPMLLSEGAADEWDEWSDWSKCVKTGKNEWIQYRTRLCAKPDVTSGHARCHGNFLEERPCSKKRRGSKHENET